MTKTTIATLAAILSAATAQPAPSAADSPPLANAAEVRAFLRGDFRDGRLFELNGVVVARPNGKAVIIEDETGRTLVFSVPPSMPAPGDIVVARGHAKISHAGYRFLKMTEFTKNGHVEPPKPIAATANQIADGEVNLHYVTVKGYVTDVFRDEIDDRYWYLVLKSGSRPLYLTIAAAKADMSSVNGLRHAFVEVMGFVSSSAGRRLFIGNVLSVAKPGDIKILKPPPEPFGAPPLESMYDGTPNEVGELGLRRISGTVLASWRRDAFLLRADDGRNIKVETRDGESAPAAGRRVEVAGFPETDFFRINLSRALVHMLPGDGKTPTADEAAGATPDDILRDKEGNSRIQTGFFGRTVKMRGTVSTLPPPGEPYGRMNVKCGDVMVPVNVGPEPGELSEMEEGSTVEVVGVCLLESENWTAGAQFPHISGFTLLLRSPGDVRVLAAPPFWTSGKLLAVIAALVLALAMVATWSISLRRLAEKRGRELFDAEIAQAGAALKVEERTRLAMDLHDSLAQNLAAVAYQIEAAQTTRNVNAALSDSHMDTANRMLKACRTELRQCLWDLRSEALEDCDFADALRKVCTPVAGAAKVAVRFAVPRSRISDATAHSLLCIARELVSNAVRHGHAASVRIAGELRDGRIRVAVRDDGSGFVPDDAPNQLTGHFGLAGIRERVKKLGGTLEIESSPGAGARAVVSIYVPRDVDTKETT